MEGAAPAASLRVCGRRRLRLVAGRAGGTAHANAQPLWKPCSVDASGFAASSQGQGAPQHKDSYPASCRVTRPLRLFDLCALEGATSAAPHGRTAGSHWALRGLSGSSPSA